MTGELRYNVACISLVSGTKNKTNLCTNNVLLVFNFQSSNPLKMNKSCCKVQVFILESPEVLGAPSSPVTEATDSGLKT